MIWGLDFSLSYKKEQMYSRKDVYRKRNRNIDIEIEIEQNRNRNRNRIKN